MIADSARMIGGSSDANWKYPVALTVETVVHPVAPSTDFSIVKVPIVPEVCADLYPVARALTSHHLARRVAVVGDHDTDPVASTIGCSGLHCFAIRKFVPS